MVEEAAFAVLERRVGLPRRLAVARLMQVSQLSLVCSMANKQEVRAGCN